MSFPFSEICTLLSRLEDIEHHEPPILRSADKSAQVKIVIESWFKSHGRHIHRLDITGAVALLSTLLPERRTDRVYGIQSASLCRILCRCLGLRSARAKELEAYKQPGRGDLALCLERVLKDDGPPARPPVTLGDVDEMLETLAGNCRFSDPSRRRLPSGSSKARDEVLGNVLKRLDATQAKWLVRLVLKDFSFQLEEALVLHSFHFLLPDLLRFQNDLESAIRLLRGPLKEYPDNPDPRSCQLHLQGAAGLLKPSLRVKVGRPNFYKARSIENCMKMCGSKRWVLERKYDGEYCEIHIDMSRSHNPTECITIFSKSGKNSTEDRKGLHQTLVDCLKLGKPECKIKRQGILLGELVVYSDKERRILPFETIRKYVSRSGVSLGTDQDSQPHAYEHLAIVFFDLLLLDDQIVMRKPLEERRSSLRKVYTKTGGRAMSSEWKIVDFSNSDRSKAILIQQLAASIAERCEGLILKPASAPYFPLNPQENGHVDGYIKLKSDYIAGMGDEADFAVVGGSYNSQMALKSGVANLKWTDFHLGCLVNKIDVLRFDARPRFKIVGTIQSDQCIPKPVLEAVNATGVFSAHPFTPGQPSERFDVECTSSLKMDVIFSEPFVFEVLGSGFEKPSSCNFFMLRHPRVKKLHQDRTWKDCVSMEELQDQGKAARVASPDSESQETRRLIQKLEGKCRKKRERQLDSTPRSEVRAIPLGPNQPEATLDGTTLIGEASCGSKRARQELDQTPCRAPKRHRLDTGKGSTSKLDQQAPEPTRKGRASSPLSDITNIAPTSPVLHRAARTQKSNEPLHKPSVTSTLLARRKDNPSLPTLRPCIRQNCPFTSSPTIIYLAPCIAHTPYIISDLLHTRHRDILIASNLTHWDRDSLAHPPLGEIVSESPAFAGRRKVVLVEARRGQAVEQVVGQVLGLNKGIWRERVEVWDWRVLEGCSLDTAPANGELEKSLVGKILFDPGEGRGVFVENHSGVFVAEPEPLVELG